MIKIEMHVYFDTVRRTRPVKEGGELIQLDWATKRIINALPIFPSEPNVPHDPNPRGNSRGGKGIVLHDHEIFVGTYHTILVFDRNLRLKRTISNPLFVNIHEMVLKGKHLWVSSTAIDCALLINQEGKTLRSWWPREEPVLQKKYGLFPMDIDKTIDNRLKYLHKQVSLNPGHTHLNCVTTHGERTFALLNKLGVLVQIEPEVKVILEDRKIRGGHSAKVINNGEQIVLCGSFGKELLFCDLHQGKIIKELKLLMFDELRKLHENSPDQPYNKSLFVRGLDIINGQRVLVGVSPASILEIDIINDQLIDSYQYSSDVGDAVHGLIHVESFLPR